MRSCLSLRVKRSKSMKCWSAAYISRLPKPSTMHTDVKVKNNVKRAVSDNAFSRSIFTEQTFQALRERTPFLVLFEST